jgi:replicative DNA helicase
MQEVIDLLQFRADNPGVLRGMSTGFCKLDKFIDGMNTGLFTVAGATGEGKSSFAMNMAINVAKGMKASGDDSNVLYFAMEMPAIEMKLRMVSCLSGTPFNSTGMTYEEMRLLRGAIAEMSKLNILFDESGHPSIDFIVNRARKLHRERKLKLIVSDYAQLIKVPKSRGNDASDLNFVSKALQALSMELGIPIVNVAMLKRAEKQWDKYKKEWFTPPPSLGDVSGSAGFENDSVVVAMLQRDADNNTKIYLPKNRHGPRNVSVDLRFEAAIYRFTEK